MLPEYGSYRNRLQGKPGAYYRERSSPFGKDDQLIIPSTVNWEEWTEIIRHAFAHITMLDAAGGMIVDKLKELGLDKNTMIIGPQITATLWPARAAILTRAPICLRKS